MRAAGGNYFVFLGGKFEISLPERDLNFPFLGGILIFPSWERRGLIIIPVIKSRPIRSKQKKLHQMMLFVIKLAVIRQTTQVLGDL